MSRAIQTVAAMAVTGALIGPVGDAVAQPVLNFVGVTAHNWGTWVAPGTELEEWLDEARAYCAGEDVCELHVFEGRELATHEYPVPEANRAALKWVFLYRSDETPRIVVTEAHAAPGEEPRRWTFER